MPIAHGVGSYKKISAGFVGVGAHPVGDCLCTPTPMGDGFGLLVAANRCAGFAGLGAERGAMKPDKIPHL